MTDDEPIDVAAIRQELGLSQAAFAERVGVDQSTVSLWESGAVTPRGPAQRWMQSLLAEHRRAAEAA